MAHRFPGLFTRDELLGMDIRGLVLFAEYGRIVSGGGPATKGEAPVAANEEQVAQNWESLRRRQ